MFRDAPLKLSKIAIKVGRVTTTFLEKIHLYCNNVAVTHSQFQFFIEKLCTAFLITGKSIIIYHLPVKVIRFLIINDCWCSYLFFQIGFTKLTYIGGNMRVHQCYSLCFVNTINWNQIIAPPSKFIDDDSFPTTEGHIRKQDCPKCPAQCPSKKTYIFFKEIFYVNKLFFFCWLCFVVVLINYS